MTAALASWLHDERPWAQLVRRARQAGLRVELSICGVGTGTRLDEARLAHADGEAIATVTLDCHEDRLDSAAVSLLVYLEAVLRRGRLA